MTARDQLGNDFGDGVIYTSERSHHSIPKAARIAGIASERIRFVPVDHRLRMDPDALDAMVSADIEAGLRPMMIVATAGTTDTGAIDPLNSCADIAARATTWFHVDAAYGGFFQLTERGRERFEGIDRADSITVDAHKSLFLPFGVGGLLVRDIATLVDAHSGHGVYMQDVAAAGTPHFFQLGVELTRPNRGINVWLPLHLHGVNQLTAVLDSMLDLAEWSAATLDSQRIFDHLSSTGELHVPTALPRALAYLRSECAPQVRQSPYDVGVPNYTKPGVYVEEIPSGERPIEAVSTSVLGVVGVTMAGAVSEPTKLTSWQGFIDAFGRTDPGSFTAEAVWGFFHNGGSEAWVVKVPHPTVPDGTPEAATHDPDAVLAEVLVEGIDSLDGSSPVDLLICPDMLMVQDDGLRAPVIEAMERFAERYRRFAIVDLPSISDDQALVNWRLKQVTSSFAATYAPHLEIVHLDPGAPDPTRLVPPSGLVAGAYATTDKRRGVWKAPAGVEVQGVVGLRQVYTDARQDLLNPNAVNVIREFPQRGIMIWGARTAADESEWRYVAVRRLANMIERSITRSTQWATFEPNDEPLWASVRSSIEGFLFDLWSEGGLVGSKPEDAFFVRVGLGDTMTKGDIAEGRLIVVIGFAPLRPAEFTVITITHQLSGD